MVVSFMRRWAIVRIAFVSVATLVMVSESSAHQGPPFPLLMDQPLADYKISVWADPDIGEARFFIILESPEGGPPREEPQRVNMWIEPVSGRLDRVTVQVTRGKVQNELLFEARPYFDQGDQWNIGFQVTDASGTAQELTTQVESTPPGYGVWDLAIYLFPFLFLAGFWALAMKRRRARLRESAATETDSKLSAPNRQSESTAVDLTADPRG